MKRLLRYLLGYVRLKIKRDKAEEFINLLRDRKIDSWGYFAADTYFQFFTTRRGQRLLEAQYNQNDFGETESEGLLFCLYRFRGRVGLLLGFLVSVLVFLLLSSVVWDIRIEGNEHLSDMQIMQELEKAGLSVGVPLRSLDEKQVASDVLLSSKTLSFLSINQKGTVAYVTVRERDAVPEKEEKGCANLVASADAVIESLSVSVGSVQVHSGQVVKKGDVLVSGITEGLHGNRLVRAEGEVFGRVQHVFTITIPEYVTVLEQENAQMDSFSFLFLGKSINIYRNTGNLPDNYATIYQRDSLYLGHVKLPFGVERSIRRTCAEKTVSLSPNEQVQLAYFRLQEQMMLSLGEAEMISKRVVGGFGADGYTLTCYIESLENIALMQEFSVQ